MNWYKLKFAFPTIEDPKQYQSYFNIGHFRNEDVILWFIDNSLNFHFLPKEQSKFMNHINWNDYTDAEENGDLLARGRCEVNTKITSAYIHKQLKDKQLDYAKRKIEQILDKNLNNPKIIFN